MNTRHFPFHALGFRCNPFRALADEEWAEIAVLPGAVAEILERGFDHLQLLGPLGCGKTTVLLGLAARFAGEGKRVAYEYLAERQRRFQTDLRPLDHFLLDEAQRLSPFQRRRLLSRAASPPAGRLCLFLSSHEDLAPLFARLALPLATIRLDLPDPDHLRAVLERRLAWFALDGNPRVSFTPDAARFLSDRFGADLRAAEWFLYEVFQRWSRPDAITPRQLEDAWAALARGTAT